MTSRGLGQAFHGAHHYENFPVASWLIPGAIRPSVVQLYRFARTGDDLADEGRLSMAARMAGLAALRTGLWEQDTRTGSAFESPATASAVTDSAGLAVAEPSLQEELSRAGISLSGLALLGKKTGQVVGHHPSGRHWADQLLQAFEYDAAFLPFADWQSVLQYCRKSAAPVGRLMLGLFGLWSEADHASSAQSISAAPEADLEEARVFGKEAIFAESDAICIGLQLVNFAQDLHQDLARHRPTLPQTDWPQAWSWQPIGPAPEGPQTLQTPQAPQAPQAIKALQEEAQLRRGLLQGDTPAEEKIRITRAIAVRGLHQLARGRDLPKRIEATRIPHARRLAFEVALTLEGGTTIGERLMQKPLLGWKASTRLSRLWLAAVLFNRLPRMLFKNPFPL
ncbi:MAG: squalene/phytoene synthase family protein [Burkholderiaceae bacterium]